MYPATAQTAKTLNRISGNLLLSSRFIDAYKAMTDMLSKQRLQDIGDSSINEWNVRVIEKLSHFGLALALDNAVGGSQKREVFLSGL